MERDFNEDSQRFDVRTKWGGFYDLELPLRGAYQLQNAAQAIGLAKALGDIARAKGMTQVAHDAGLSRESLYKALSGDRSPGFDTILRVVHALGLELHAAPVHS